MIEIDNKDVGERLLAMRSSLQMGSADFARGAGIGPKSYSQAEIGAARLSLSNAMRIREVYGVSMDWLYFGSTDTLSQKWIKALSVNSSEAQ